MTGTDAVRVPRAIALELERALGSAPVGWTAVSGGNSASRRARVRLADGRTAFAKWATDAETARWLRDEMRVIGHLEASFVPRLYAWRDDVQPFFAIEDLGAATWPPPWTLALARRGMDALARVAATPAPAGLPPAAELAELLRGWARVERDPAPFLALGLADAAWLARALPTLRAAEDAASFAGDALLHNDARGDNMAFLPPGAGDEHDGRVVLVDWNWAAVGPAGLDRAHLANHVHATGGPAPEELAPDDGGWAPVLAGFYAAEAGRPPIPGAPGVRPLQRAHLATALPWAIRALGLPAPSG